MRDVRTPLHQQVRDQLSIHGELTARQVSQVLGRYVGDVSSLMSKMALYGALDRRRKLNGRRNEYFYRIKRNETLAT